MRISNERFSELKTAIDAIGGLRPEASMRQRWDALWASRYDVRRLYKDGLNDAHIDTALRSIAVTAGRRQVYDLIEKFER